MVTNAGFRIGNLDATIIAQEPRMAPHIPRMVENIAADLGVAVNAVNVKATTTERLGLAGAGRYRGTGGRAIVSLNQHKFWQCHSSLNHSA